MGRPDDQTIVELAATVGVSPHTMRTWSKRPGFPAPSGTRTGGRGTSPKVWRVHQVAAWLAGCGAAVEADEAARDHRPQAAANKEARRRLVAEVAELVDAGRTTPEIADELGITYWSARRIRRLAGLKGNRGAHPQFTADDCIEALRDAAGDDDTISEDRYRRWRMTVRPDAPGETTLRRHLGERSWSGVVAAAGLRARPAAGGNPAWTGTRWTDEELIDAIHRSEETTVMGYEIWRRGDGRGTPSSGTIIARFGSWADAKRRAENERCPGP